MAMGQSVLRWAKKWWKTLCSILKDLHGNQNPVMDAINKHLNSKKNHHQWYQVNYEILDFDEDAFTDCNEDEVNAEKNSGAKSEWYTDISKANAANF